MKGEAGTAVDILVGVGDFGDLWTWLQEQLQSVASLVAVEGALSASPSVATAASPASSDFALLLDWLLALLALLAMLPAVEVRFSGAFPARGAVRGGLTSEGDAMEIDFRKSI